MVADRYRARQAHADLQPPDCRQWRGYFYPPGCGLPQHDSSLKTLVTTLVIACLVILVAAFGIGWVLSGITLQPIQRITQTAQAIGAEHDFSRRVAYNGPPDEVGQLATTFNSMLARLEQAYRACRSPFGSEMQAQFCRRCSQ